MASSHHKATTTTANAASAATAAAGPTFVSPDLLTARQQYVVLPSRDFSADVNDNASFAQGFDPSGLPSWDALGLAADQRTDVVSDDISADPQFEDQFRRQALLFHQIQSQIENRDDLSLQTGTFSQSLLTAPQLSLASSSRSAAEDTLLPVSGFELGVAGPAFHPGFSPQSTYGLLQGGPTTQRRPNPTMAWTPPSMGRRRSAPDDSSTKDPDKRPAKLKKSTTDPDQVESDDDDDPAAALARIIQSRSEEATRLPTSNKPQAQTRLPHHQVERRYRDNLNNQIEALRLALPRLRDAHLVPMPTGGGGSGVEDDSYLNIPPKTPSKAVIISSAVSYIHELESQNDKLTARIQDLKGQVERWQKMVQHNKFAPDP